VSSGIEHDSRHLFLTFRKQHALSRTLNPEILLSQDMIETFASKNKSFHFEDAVTFSFDKDDLSETIQLQRSFCCTFLSYSVNLQKLI